MVLQWMMRTYPAVDSHGFLPQEGIHLPEAGNKRWLPRRSIESIRAGRIVKER